MNCVNHPEVVAGVVPCARCGQPFCQDCVVELAGKPYDAACKDEQVRDLRSGATEAAYATPLRRFGAIFVDGLVMSPLTIFLAVKYAGAGMFDNYLPRIVLPALVWVVYEALMLKRDGQTLGKKAVDIRVVNADGSDLRGQQVWTRAISRQFMSITYILGIIDALMVFSDQRRTLHDRFGSTLVVSSKG